MQEAIQLKQAMLERLDKLNTPRLRQVLDFGLFARTPNLTNQKVPGPSGERPRFIGYCGYVGIRTGGTWILQDIEQSRLIELDKSYDSLLA